MVTGNCLLLRLAEQSSGRGKPDVCLVLYTSRVAFIAGRLDVLRAQVNQISEERNCLEEQREEGSLFTPGNVTHPEGAQRIAGLSRYPGKDVYPLAQDFGWKSLCAK